MKRSNTILVYVSLYVIFILLFPRLLNVTNIYSYIILCLWGMWLFRKELQQGLYDFSRHIVKSFILLFVLFILSYVGEALMSLVAYIISQHYNISLDSSTVNTGVFTALQSLSLLIILPIIILLGPMVEEFIFRKVLLTFIDRSFSTWFAILLQALLFGFIHLNQWTLADLLQLLPYFSTGIIYGIVQYRTGNIVYVIVLHSLSNLLSVLPFILNL